MILFIACVLTVAIETPFLMLCGYRGKTAVTVIVCANVATNLTLNMLLAFVLGPVGGWIYALEAAVVAAEYAVYAQFFRPGLRLFTLTLAANCLSYGIGLLIF